MPGSELKYSEVTEASAPTAARFSCSFESKEATAAEVVDRHEAEANGSDVRVVGRAEVDEMARACCCSSWAAVPRKAEA